MELLAGTYVPAGLSYATVLPDMDFETYSAAGYVWREDTQKWISISGKGKTSGISQVGAAVYAEHESTEVLELGYNLKDGTGKKLWQPGLPPPQDLFDHLANGGLIEAHNAAFEYYIWWHVCVCKMGWPMLPLNQLRCSSAKAKSFSLPAALGKVAEIVGVELKDVAEGKKAIKRYCCPRQPTKNDKRRRIHPSEEDQGIVLGQYCLQDIAAESSVSMACPDLSPYELDLWLLDQKINVRGMHIDMAAVRALNSIIAEGQDYFDQKVQGLTAGAVRATSEVAAQISFLRTRGVHLDNLDEDSIDMALGMDLDPTSRELLTIRRATRSAGVKKLQAMIKRTSADNRMRDTLNFYRAHTGRWSSEGLQTQNLKSGGPKMARSSCCGFYFPISVHQFCPMCVVLDPLEDAVEWSAEPMSACINLLSTCDFQTAIAYFGDQLYMVIAACIRGLICAAEGKELLCSDYSAIEAVVLAVTAGEDWRVEVFRTHGKIYEMTASDITGIPFGEIVNHQNGSHPARKPFGKVPELASGYGGWIGAWKAFGADEFFSDTEIKENILKWRDASPNIVEMWGGQWRLTSEPGERWEFTHELFGLEGTAIKAVLEPDTWHTWRFARYGVFGGVLYCLLPSGRCLSYHSPQLAPSLDRRSGKDSFSLSHMLYNTNPQKGRVGWIRVETYGGMLTENFVQAVARDLLAHGLKNVEAAGYTVVGHVHDEIISEVDAGYGSVDEFEELMMTLPDWAQGWPIKAAGGWRGHRYRKE